MADMDIICTGLSGHKYTFEVYEIGEGFKQVPAVYIFVKQDSFTLECEPVYVGETGNIQDRLNENLENHHAWECIVENEATYVCIYHHNMRSRKARLQVERDLRQSLDPPCNRQ